MEDQYAMADLRHLMTARPHFPGVLTPSPAADLFPAAPHYGMLMMGREMMPRGTASNYAPDYAAPAAAGTGSSGTVAGPFMEGDLGCLGGDGGTGRWPRQETLTLLEIRSRLDHKFKEANQKGPLWDEVSRIMCEEHGYQRSGKKCREKFENLYKYYKKTKEGKAGRQDGKHYRFFRQLEALYGGGTGESYAADAVPRFAGSNPYSVAPAPAGAVTGEGDHRQEALQASLSLSSSSYADTSSSEDCNKDDSGEPGEKRRRGGGRRSWKAKVREFVDGQMRRLMEKQEAWLDGMLRTLEHKEQERILRDEEWRRQEASRLDREHRFWANERAWVRVRDAALLEALQKLSDGGGDRLPKPSSPEELMVAPPEIHDGGGETHAENGGDGGDRWCEGEIARLIHLRTAMEPRFQHGGCPEEVIWEEIAAEMGCLGYERSGAAVKEKWDVINDGLAGGGPGRVRESDRSTRGFCYFPMTADAPPYRPGGDAAPTSNGDGCLRFLTSDGGGDHSLWESYGLRLKGGNH